MSIINSNLSPIIVIAGATATGKTNAAVAIAKKIDGEIISADSMQVYKYMDIGTAKPTAGEMQGIPHYLIDELFPDEEFNVAVFKEMAEKYLSKIQEKGKTPVITGGTGFYINALIRNTDFSGTAVNKDIREYYEALAYRYGKTHIHNILAEKDPASAAAIHPNNLKRVIRAIEYFETAGIPIVVHNSIEKAKIINDNIYYFILDLEREALYEKINKRVDKMMYEGLLKEVISLLEMGYNEGLTSMQGIGYKELVKHIRGEYTFTEAVDKIKQTSRNYAKRQVTWFKHQTDGTVINANLQTDEIYEFIEAEINRRNNDN